MMLQSHTQSGVIQKKDATITERDATISNLEKSLAELRHKHEPCDDLIASLRKQISALESTRGQNKVCVQTHMQRTDIRMLSFAHTNTHTHMQVSAYSSMCVCMCVCV